MIVATTSPHPHIQPICGPNAFTVHVNDVPASGAALLSPRYAYATSSIGTNPIRKTPGICTPTSVTVGPSVAVSAYAGATEEIASTTLPSNPTESWTRPLSVTSARSTAVMRAPFH